MSTTTTRAPAPASIRAVASPRPEAPPVTMAATPLMSMAGQPTQALPPGTPLGRLSRDTGWPSSARPRWKDLRMASLTPTATPDIQVSEPERELEHGPVAHIVRTDPGESATAKILQARVEGTPIEALCGHVWVPSRDPRQLPVCPACKE